MKKFIVAPLCMAILSGFLVFGLQGKSLQADDGQVIMENRCTTCHGAGRIERAGHDMDGWKDTVSRMEGKGNFGEPLSDAERQSLLKHLESL